VATLEASGEGRLVARYDLDIVSVAIIVRRPVLLVRELLLIKFTVVHLLHVYGKCRVKRRGQGGGGEGSESCRTGGWERRKREMGKCVLGGWGAVNNISKMQVLCPPSLGSATSSGQVRLDKGIAASGLEVPR